MQLKRLGNILITICALLVIQGCSKEVLDFRNAELSNGKIYSRGSDKPFSGTVTSAPYKLITSLNEGAAPFFQTMSVQWTGIVWGDVCDVNVQNGVVDGSGVCMPRNTQFKRTAFNFKNGVLDGDFKLHVPNEQGKLMSEASYFKGRLEGTQKVFNPENGVETFSLGWKNGYQDGDQIGHSADGKYVTYKGQKGGGKPDGTEEHFFPDTGKIADQREWKLGVPVGSYKVWNSAGVLIVQENYENGVATSYSLPSQQKTNEAGCMDAWVNTFKKGNPDDLVTEDQMGEWKQWCGEGKMPA
jgi:hypothetical protein